LRCRRRTRIFAYGIAAAASNGEAIALPRVVLSCQDAVAVVLGGGISMSTLGPDQSPQPALTGKQLALIVYILYLVAYFTGITMVIGVIIAHVQVGSADPLLASHYRFQIRTFWIGVLYLVIGTILTMVLIGIAVLFWWFIWSLVRNIKGVLALNENKPIANPASWLFG
jgi:uncharacterized membrane protein